MARARSQPVSDDNNPAAKKRSNLGRIIIWSVILLLVCAGIFEGAARYCYETTLSKLEAATQSRANGTDRGIPVGEIDQAIRGFCFRKTEFAGQADRAELPIGGAGRARTIVLSWPSLIKKLQMGVKVSEADRAVAVLGDYLEPIGPQVVQNAGANVAKAEPPRPRGLMIASDDLVVLSTDELKVTTEMRKRKLGSLVREFIRQSFLIAARDELKLFTLDESLGETSFVAADAKSFPFQITVNLEGDAPAAPALIVTVNREQPGGKNWTWSSTPVALAQDTNLNQMIEALEGLSRDQFVSALKSAGFAAQSVSSDPPVAAPSDLESSMDVVSQYTLIKQLHAQRRQQGDTIENLAALSGAYARLASFVEYHWSPMSKAFGARALLYAQRLQSKFGKTCITMAQRAYAWALVGNLKLAEQDVAASRNIDTDPSTLPDWLNFVDLYCQFQPLALGQFTGPRRTQALYFRMKALHPVHDEQKALAAIEEMLLEAPGCMRAVQRMCEMSSLGPLRQATEGAVDPVWDELYERLGDVPELPSVTAEIVTRHSLRTRPSARDSELLNLIESLRQPTWSAGPSAEPSWSLLGEIFSNEKFRQTAEKLWVAANKLGFPRNDVEMMRKAELPGVKGHRFENFFWGFTTDQAATSTAIVQIYNSTNPAYFEMTTLPIARVAAGTPNDIQKRLYEHIDNHLDNVQYDIMGAIDSNWDHWEKEGFLNLIEICPHQPLSIARRIHTTPDFDSTKSREWEAKYPDNSYLLWELGMRHRNLKQYDDAIRCQKKSIEASPTRQAYFQLSELYKQADDLDACIETLEDSLNLPALGLEHGQANEKIANILMSQSRWKEARQYAHAAADTYSAWGLLAAARCEEGLKNWREAERFYRAGAERYDNIADNWYWWCVRTGRGNLEAARRHLEPFRAKYQSPLYWTQLWDRGGEQLLTGDIPGAIVTFSARSDESHQDRRLMLIGAIFAERQGDLPKRDALYQAVGYNNDDGRVVSGLGRLFRFATKDPNHFEWREPLLMEIVDSYDDLWVPFTYYCAGEFLINHGQEEQALKYLQMAATVANQEELSCRFAAMALRRTNQSIGERRTSVGPEERAKSVKLLRKAKYFSAQDKLPEAVALLTEAIESTPDFTPALTNRGLLYENGRDADAVADYEACLKIDPDFEFAHFNLAGLRASSNKDELRNGPAALKHAERAAELSEQPKGRHFRMLALAHAECGEFPKAIEQMEKAVKAEPKETKWAEQLELLRQGKPYRRPVREFPSK